MLVSVVAEGFWQSTGPDKGNSEAGPLRRPKLIYSLTAKGIDLAPVLTEMVLWVARHERTENQALIRLMREDTKQFNAEIRQLWASPRSIRP